MKKSMRLLILGFACLCMTMLLIPNQVSATEATVDTLDELIAALLDTNVTDITIEDTIQINETVDIIGNGKTITSKVQKTFEIHAGTVNFENITIVNAVANGRCIDVRAGGVILTLNKVTLKTTNDSTNNQTLNVGGNFTSPATINVVNSTILAGEAGYGIITFNPVKLTIDNSDITGYAALYMKGIMNSAGSAGSSVTIQNGSVLTGVNNHPAGSNDFGAIVLEDGNIAIDIKKSEVVATGTGEASQVPFQETEGTVKTANTVTIYEGAKVTAKDDITNLDSTSNSTVTFKVGATANVVIPTEHLEEGTTTKIVDDKYLVGIEHNIVVETTTGGTVEANAKTAIAGETIILTVKVDDGYEIKSLTVNGIEIKDNKFEMLDEDVKVKAEFEKIDTTVAEEKDEIPKMGVESTMLIMFTVVAIISLAGLVIIRKEKVRK